MQIESILIQTATQQLLVQHTNTMGIGGSISVPYSELTSQEENNLTALLGAIKSRLPQDPTAAVQQEIAQLESRLADLRKSIGLG